jgi:hypothetical protein
MKSRERGKQRKRSEKDERGNEEDEWKCNNVSTKRFDTNADPPGMGKIIE